MNEGVGSTSILVIMMVFLTVVSAYMAYNVNYTKAFRLKNKVISTYDKYDGDCSSGSSCWNEIQDYAEEIGYVRHSDLGCDRDDVKPSNVFQQQSRIYYCEYKIKVNEASSGIGIQDEGEEHFYYHIVARIDISIPVVQNVFALRALTVTGDTKVYTKKDS